MKPFLLFWFLLIAIAVRSEDSLSGDKDKKRLLLFDIDTDAPRVPLADLAEMTPLLLKNRANYITSGIRKNIAVAQSFDSDVTKLTLGVQHAFPSAYPDVRSLSTTIYYLNTKISLAQTPVPLTLDKTADGNLYLSLTYGVDQLTSENGWYHVITTAAGVRLRSRFVMVYRAMESDDPLLNILYVNTFSITVLINEARTKASVIGIPLFDQLCDCQITKDYVLTMKAYTVENGACTTSPVIIASLGDEICLKMSTSDNMVKDYKLHATSLLMKYTGVSKDQEAIDIASKIIDDAGVSTVIMPLVATGVVTYTGTVEVHKTRRLLGDLAASEPVKGIQGIFNIEVKDNPAVKSASDPQTSSGSTVIVTIVSLILMLVAAFI